jgi:electron transport complex protein RnfD
MLISFTGPMTTWSASKWMSGITTASPLVDAVTYATPLNAVKEALKAGHGIPFTFTPDMGWQFFFGNMNGCIGETSALALLIGAAYLLARRVITWHVPVSYIGTAFIFALIMRLLAPQISMPPMFHLLTGGLLLGAFFMATDMVTTPVTRSGLLIFGAGCGLLTMVIRTVIKGDFPEGTSFAILIMNAFTPLINRATRPKVFGCRPKCSAA